MTSKKNGLTIAFLVLGTVSTTAGTSRAGLTLGNSSGTINYAVYSTTGGESQTFVNNMLVYPGGPLPVLQGPLGDSPTQSSSGSLSPFFSSGATTNPNSSIGYVPGIFGTATTQVYASTSGQQGSFTTQGGVYWSLNTSVKDSLSNSNEASVSFSRATAMFTNNTSASITITPGAILNVTGKLNTADSTSFIAAGLTTSFTTTTNNTTTIPTVLDSIVLAAGANGYTNAAIGNPANEYGSVTNSFGTVSGTGTSLDPSRVTLIAGESITVTAYLTLISDPGSSIGISTDLPSGLLSNPQFIPDFGAFASSPSVVPEPSTVLLLGAGMTVAGLWARSSGRRRSSKS